jgi:phage-related protein
MGIIVSCLTGIIGCIGECLMAIIGAIADCLKCIVSGAFPVQHHALPFRNWPNFLMESVQ